MFDSVYVAQSLIDDIIKDQDILLEPFNGYYDFQTKDLDNFLTAFYIEANGSFVWEKRQYKERERKQDDVGWIAPLELVGDPEKLEDKRAAYIDFYDLYNTEHERVFITFTAHVKDGKLLEPICIKSVERTNLKEEQEKFKPQREKWDKVRASWEWTVASFISDAKWKISRFFHPLTKLITDLEQNLRSKARKKYLDENDSSYW
jgi:hypothetical protein